MESKPLVTIYTKAYNTRSYIRQCIESVLMQTYTNFEFLLVDNGCTDGSSEIMQEYAAGEKRIRLIRYAENQKDIGANLIVQYAAGSYYAVLDSDDWWEPQYLERLMQFTMENHLDIACTGTAMHDLASGSEYFRKVDSPFIFHRETIANVFPYYHVFFRTAWGKLARIELIREHLVVKHPPLPYGGDTLHCFHLLRHANRIGIDNSVLHHYRIHKSSVSHQYNPKRFEADVYLYNDAIDFLSAYGPVSTQNRNFLQCVYSNAVAATANVICSSGLSPAEKLREYHTIASHPVTRATYRECMHTSTAQSRSTLLELTMQAGAKLNGQNDTDFRATMQILLPRCGSSVTSSNLPLFLENGALLRSLLQDDPEALIQQLLELIIQNRYIKKYDLPNIVQALAVDKPLLCQIRDTAFLRKYTELYLMVWRGGTLPALEKMTGLLLENQVNGGKETFLQLYISLAAQENQPSAFVFGKLRLTQLYLRQNRREECRAAVAELTEMGLDDEELTALRQELEGAP